MTKNNSGGSYTTRPLFSIDIYLQFLAQSFTFFKSNSHGTTQLHSESEKQLLTVFFFLIFLKFLLLLCFFSIFAVDFRKLHGSDVIFERL